MSLLDRKPTYLISLVIGWLKLINKRTIKIIKWNVKIMLEWFNDG